MPPTPDPTPEQEARVRRLLADARHDEPVPQDVVARLDGVLADLRAGTAPSGTAPSGAGADDEVPGGGPGGSTGPADSTVVVLTARRRRRRVVTGLVAAAAVVVAGVVGVQQLGTSSGDDSASSSADSAGGSAADKELSSGNDSLSAGPARRRAYDAADAPRLSDSGFARDVARAGGTPVPGALRSPAPSEARAVRRCAPVRAGAGTRLPVYYDGVPAVLVLRPPVAGRQAVDLYACGGSVPLRSVTLTAR